MLNPENQKRIDELSKKLGLDNLSEKIIPSSPLDLNDSLERDMMSKMSPEQQNEYLNAKMATREIMNVIRHFRLTNFALIKIVVSLLSVYLKNFGNRVERNAELIRICFDIQRLSDMLARQNNERP